jgi:RNA polymerase sigma factor (TIGR02999 family)
MSDVTRILNAIEQGNAKATDELLPVVYEELRLLAAQKLSRERPGQTLEATALVHEAYLRLVGDGSQKWENRGHFFAAAAEAMRRILVERARRRRSAARGVVVENACLEPVMLGTQRIVSSDDIVALDAALARFIEIDPQKAELVKLRFFAGLTTEQAALALGISRNTANRYWAYARAWLRLELHRDDDHRSR